MRIRRALAALFVAGALSLALVPVEPRSSGSLLAQQLTHCGGFDGPLCKKQINFF